MTFLEKVEELKTIVYDALSPLIQADYWVLDLPYYENIGDTLIWQGEMDFLKLFSYKCRGMYSLETFVFPKIPETDLILLQGGGNFGDLWKRHHDFRLQVMQHYPKNKFLIFPQTVYFEDSDYLQSSIECFAQYDVVICARDSVSYEFLCKHFRNKILLVPDMAFCIDARKWHRMIRKVTNSTLLLKRSDKELKISEELESIQHLPNVIVADWPTMGAKNQVEYFRRKVFRIAKKFVGMWLYDGYMNRIYRNYLIREGVHQISTFNKIYTTRLHACILSILLNREDVVFFDNSYGKNKAFYETWLKDCDNLTMIDSV